MTRMERRLYEFKAFFIKWGRNTWTDVRDHVTYMTPMGVGL